MKNEFSWSKTRDEIFRECLRKYYFHYYASWGGWDPAAAPRTRQLYVLKNLQTRARWAGDHVHRAIRAVLPTLRGGGSAPAAEAVAQQMLAAMRLDFRDSQQRRYRQYPKKVCGLFEHEYELNVADEQWKQTADHAANGLRVFLASDLFRNIRALPPDAWLEVEELASFTLSGIKVYVQLDFAHRAGPDIAIYAWKMGGANAAPNDLPLAGCILYAVARWPVTPEQVAAVEFDLASGAAAPRRLDAAGLEEMKDTLRDSADEMSFLLEDPAANRPQPEEVFELAEDEAACRRCNFLKACPRWA
ncbi:MAG: PD-(D/E)XK nuclease family protein [Kiritimatiellaeota bacterium]|nr:PD-(D/E)XK nuclease family protein [Kiritimatiellota bacterium]